MLGSLDNGVYYIRYGIQNYKEKVELEESRMECLFKSCLIVLNHSLAIITTCLMSL